ncbi:MAG: hypothetical protein VBE63_17970 [Lamprobacter sp.]|uniref:hypothetical protein n=1 Tax=Lamprobacter sp. TaxID=3100796 RepID=UPI002B262D93|nr:hypothetical protein [Lamprobacter sp.]MEA3641804.1 hypothetical protein [Lamprobacter sp.]
MDEWNHRSETASAAQTLLFLERLDGCRVFYAERALQGMATVVSARHNGLEARISLRLDPALDAQQAAAQVIRIGGHRSSFSLHGHVLGLSVGYGVNAYLVFDPRAIARVQERLNQGASRLELWRLVRDNFSALSADELPRAQPGGDHCLLSAPGEPCCLVNATGPRLFAHTRGLAGLEGRIWETEYPLEIILALCEHFQPLVPDLMERLLEQDRRSVAEHPQTLPTIALSADELFAARPALAMFYHVEFGPYSLNAALSNEAALRILSWIGERGGFRLQVLGGGAATAGGVTADFNSTWQMEDDGPFEVSVKRR